MTQLVETLTDGLLFEGLNTVSDITGLKQEKYMWLVERMVTAQLVNQLINDSKFNGLNLTTVSTDSKLPKVYGLVDQSPQPKW